MSIEYRGGSVSTVEAPIVEAPKSLRIETPKALRRGVPFNIPMLNGTGISFPSRYRSECEGTLRSKSGAEPRPQKHFGKFLVAKVPLIATIFSFFTILL